MLLIVPPNYQTYSHIVAVMEVASALGWQLHIATSSWKIPKPLVGLEGAVYGASYFCDVVSQQMNWKLLSNPNDWLTTLTEEYSRRNVVISTVSNARLLETKKFIKPASEDKFIKAAVYESGKALPELTVFADANVLVSDTIPYVTEWRCFIKDNAVVATSCYRSYNDREAKHWFYSELNIAIEFVNRLLSVGGYVSAPSTIDVGRSKKGYMSVIESSPSYTSELYGCDPVGALLSIKDACVMQ